MNDRTGEKPALRQQLLAKRRALDPALVHEASLAIAARVLALPELREARCVALYQALRNEVETLPIWRELTSTGRQVLFPRVLPGDRVLSFAPVDDPAELEVGSLGVREPPASRDVPIESIDLFVVPALGFDRAGRRLGRGGGYYDATLAARPDATRVGLCLDLQESIPAEAHDEPVDVVVTPSLVVRPAARTGGSGPTTSPGR